MADEISPQTLKLLTARIVGGYLRHHAVATAELPSLVACVHRTLGGLRQPVAPTPEVRAPAVPVRRSVQRDHVVCLECGFRAKVLRRHLAGRHGLTPAEYRARWRLPSDHPIVAPAYAERRSAMAKHVGLGRRLQSSAPEAAPEAQLASTPKRRGRSRAAATAQGPSAEAE